MNEKILSPESPEKTKAEIIEPGLEFTKVSPPRTDKPRKKKPRPVESPPGIPIQSLEVLKLVFNSLLPPRFGDHWKLSDPELNAFAAALDPVIVKYTGFVFEKYREELTLAIVAGGIIIPRFLIGRKESPPDFPDLKIKDNKTDEK